MVARAAIAASPAVLRSDGARIIRNSCAHHSATSAVESASVMRKAAANQLPG